MDKPEDFIYSITSNIYSKIVKYQDEQMIQTIQEYIKNRQQNGELCFVNILSEGQVRHIINLGIMEYAKRKNIPVTQDDLFTQEDYIHYLNTRLDKAERELQKYKNLDYDEER